ncbi:MAG: tRNA (adenosine(37)-N6)-threonylcarbamoyltransferase complex dimerization subunit type 1 TsaB [Candidatus Omnitrophica bacterium]|nr:tRNA (adenosine(37)-N6)-threonylcarbamoyltransferase complex dimerization subunit type 1 TsaB [Candidatus Omnitrophota bacterium]
MKILGIDTTTKNLCLGVYAGGKLYEYNLEVGRSLSELLAPTIQRVVAAAGLKIADIDYFACGLGPGSFTGMRIGLATIKGLSLVRNKPVIGISSLDILAGNVGPTERPIVTALDARRGLIYCSSYKYERGSLKRKSPYSLLSLDEFLKRFRAAKPVILGDALALYGNRISTGIKGAAVLDKDYWGLKAHNLMELALVKIKARQFTSALNVKPIYLYPKECQIKTK